jgi:hypothetical protein
MSKSNSNLCLELQEAIIRGFTKDLHLDEDGDFASSTHKVVAPKVIEIIQCHYCSATLYLVAGENSNGTWVHHWD